MKEVSLEFENSLGFQLDLDIVCASYRQDVLDRNLGASKYILHDVYLDYHVQRGFDNIPKAYNAIQSTAAAVMYIHEDVALPDDTFWHSLKNALENVPDDWGVLGVAGVRLEGGLKTNYGHIRDRGKEWGSPTGLPAEVDTLDELLLITRGDLKFDERFPLDFYGADICLQARAQGRKCYAINAYCEHNSSRSFGGRTPSFYESQEKFKQKWKDYLPIATTCALLK